jgi:diguanylate cyclase (GGDEF)-like protein
MTMADAPDAAAAPLSLADENALLRAALAELRARVAELEAAETRDPLTGLPNRQAFLGAVEQAVSRAERHGVPAAVLTVDLAGLKRINERHGQLAGDAALIHVARLLGGLIRASDTAGRIGGDEFGLVLDHLDADSAIDTAERIRRCIADHPLDLGGAVVALDAAVGLATILKGDSLEDVLRRVETSIERARAL